MMNNFAFADRNGRIEFGPFVPNGRLPIADAGSSDNAERLREIIEGICRHGYDGETLLVPGIPEADSDDQALDALLEFRRRVGDRLAFVGRAWEAPAAADELADVIHKHDCQDAAEPTLEADPLAPGAILYSSWGYDQTNVDFYRVVKTAGDWITLEEIAKIEHSDDTEDRPATFTGRVVPADPIKPIGAPFRRKILERTASGTVAKLKSYAYAYLWDGTPKRVSSYA